MALAGLYRAGFRPWQLSLLSLASNIVVGWLLISVSWALRGTAVFLLFDALSMRSSFPLALAFLCASAASAALPIAPAGAATQAGAGAAILIVGGIPKGQALAFAVAAQGLVILVGAVLVAAAGIWALVARFRPARPILT